MKSLYQKSQMNFVYIVKKLKWLVNFKNNLLVVTVNQTT